MAVSVALSITAMGTVGPAVMGIVPMGVTLGVCTVLPATPPWACGLKARFAGLEGSLTPPPTFSGVHTLPVTGSRKPCPEACPKAIEASATATAVQIAKRMSFLPTSSLISNLGASGRGLGHRRSVAGQGRAPHVARLVGRERPRAMHGLA